MIVRFTNVPVLLALAIGCSHQSTYTRKYAAPGEIVWAYDGRLVATRDGQVLNDKRWRGLSEAVRCVPEAEALAQQATARGKERLAKAIDAVNLYNQRFMNEPGCPGYAENAAAREPATSSSQESFVSAAQPKPAQPEPVHEGPATPPTDAIIIEKLEQDIRAKCPGLPKDPPMQISFLIEPSGRVLGLTASPSGVAGDCARAQVQGASFAPRAKSTPIAFTIR